LHHFRPERPPRPRRSSAVRPLAASRSTSQAARCGTRSSQANRSQRRREVGTRAQDGRRRRNMVRSSRARHQVGGETVEGETGPRTPGSRHGPVSPPVRTAAVQPGSRLHPMPSVQEKITNCQVYILRLAAVPPGAAEFVAGTRRRRAGYRSPLYSYSRSCRFAPGFLWDSNSIRSTRTPGSPLARAGAAPRSRRPVTPVLRGRGEGQRIRKQPARSPP
jgi:hypothetical protein